MKRGITAENYSHMLANVTITPRLMTQEPIARVRTLGESSPFLLRTSEFDVFTSKHKRSRVSTRGQALAYNQRRGQRHAFSPAPQSPCAFLSRPLVLISLHLLHFVRMVHCLHASASLRVHRDAHNKSRQMHRLSAGLCGVNAFF